ncbi:hypothetical protein HDV05_007450, partial [Chytridiales sp. JEL 0842]
ALESVFPPSELSTFISLPRPEKESQLAGLTQLVTGIRLFNKTLHKGGETIDDLISLCAAELEGLGKGVEGEMGRVEGEIQEQTLKSRETLSQLGQKFDSTLQALKATCKSKTAVPVDQVYPHFITLSTLWTLFNDHLFLLSFRRGILDKLRTHSTSFSNPLPNSILEKAEKYKREIEPPILSDSEIVERAGELMVSLSVVNKSVEVLHPGNTTSYFHLPVEYGSFCAYTLLKREGVVVPGDKNLGLVKYRERLFAFASVEGAREFAKFPDRYMEGVVELAKRCPDLVQLLGLYKYFPTVDALENAKSYTRQRLLHQTPLTSNAATQVDTHITDTFLDPKYQWNEWELRRQALMLVNLKGKRTKGAQTVVSQFRRESETQHWDPKVQETQTRTESSTNVPRKVNYLMNLRNDGKKESKFKVVDLTLDL